MNVKQFLNELLILIPKDFLANHSIILKNGVVTVSVMANGKWYDFHLDDEDLAKDGKQLAQELKELWVKTYKTS